MVDARHSSPAANRATRAAGGLGWLPGRIATPLIRWMVKRKAQWKGPPSKPCLLTGIPLPKRKRRKKRGASSAGFAIYSSKRGGLTMVCTPVLLLTAGLAQAQTASVTPQGFTDTRP